MRAICTKKFDFLYQNRPKYKFLIQGKKQQQKNIVRWCNILKLTRRPRQIYEHRNIFGKNLSKYVNP